MIEAARIVVASTTSISQFLLIHHPSIKHYVCAVSSGGAVTASFLLTSPTPCSEDDLPPRNYTHCELNSETFDNCAVCGPCHHLSLCLAIHWISVAWVRYAAELIKFITANWNAPNRKINSQKSSRPCVLPGANPEPNAKYTQERKTRNLVRIFGNMQLHMIISSGRPVAPDPQRLERKRIQFAQQTLHARIPHMNSSCSICCVQKSRHQHRNELNESERASFRPLTWNECKSM